MSLELTQALESRLSSIWLIGTLLNGDRRLLGRIFLGRFFSEEFSQKDSSLNGLFSVL